MSEEKLKSKKIRFSSIFVLERLKRFERPSISGDRIKIPFYLGVVDNSIDEALQDISDTIRVTINETTPSVRITAGYSTNRTEKEKKVRAGVYLRTLMLEAKFEKILQIFQAVLHGRSFCVNALSKI